MAHNKNQGGYFAVLTILGALALIVFAGDFSFPPLPEEFL